MVDMVMVDKGYLIFLVIYFIWYRIRRSQRQRDEMLFLLPAPTFTIKRNAIRLQQSIHSYCVICNLPALSTPLFSAPVHEGQFQASEDPAGMADQHLQPRRPGRRCHSTGGDERDPAVQLHDAQQTGMDTSSTSRLPILLLPHSLTCDKLFNVVLLCSISVESPRRGEGRVGGDREPSLTQQQ